MPMRDYAVLCTHPGCRRPAAFKIASAWSDGATAELKTYALCCEACLSNEYDRALTKQRLCRVASGESLRTPAIYELSHGRRDRGLTRREDLEQSACAESTPVS